MSGRYPHPPLRNAGARLACAVGLACATALAGAASAEAHVDPVPPFLASGGSTSVELVGPNERDDPMTGFSVSVPRVLTIEHILEAEGWNESLDGATANWTGGSLAPDETASFRLHLRADAEPGVVELEAKQLYADGAEVVWPVALTITPEVDAGSEDVAVAGTLALIGLLTLVAVAMLAWRRRGRSGAP